jgi:hypothetical protein
MHPIEIRAEADFQSYFKDIVSKYGQNSVVFRGQVLDKPLIPSLLRGVQQSSRAPGCIPQLTANWSICAKRIVSGFQTAKHSGFEIQAIMQHYGYRSLMIDVTSDPKIALWFALHKFTSEQAPLFIENELRSAVFQWSRYVPCQTGYIYMLKMPKSQDYKYVDLTQIMPYAAARVHTQKAAAIVCSRKPADDLIISKLKVVDSGWFRDSQLDTKTTSLFPLPNVDRFYRKLCTVPYYVLPIREKQEIKLAHPLLGMFPIYAESHRELFTEYVPLTRILSQAHPALKWGVATGATEFENKRYKVRGAIRILLSRLMVESISKPASGENTIQRQAFPSDNIVLEFEPEASLVTPSSEALSSVIRGLWLILGQNAIWVIEIIDNFKDVFLGHEFAYSKHHLKPARKNRNYNDDSYNLRIITNLSQMLANGTLHLEKVDQYYWKIEYGKRKNPQHIVENA